MPFPALGWGYVVRHSLTATLLVKSVTFPKCEKCNRVLYKVKYKMVVCVTVVGNLWGQIFLCRWIWGNCHQAGKVWSSVRNGCFKISLKTSELWCVMAKLLAHCWKEEQYAVKCTRVPTIGKQLLLQVSREAVNSCSTIVGSLPKQPAKLKSWKLGLFVSFTVLFSSPLPHHKQKNTNNNYNPSSYI